MGAKLFREGRRNIMLKSFRLADDELIYRLRKLAEIRRQIQDRKSVQEGKPDKIANILDEAADEIERLDQLLNDLVNERGMHYD